MISILGCYLPTRLRRWFIYLPIDLLLVLLLVGGGVLVYAATISSSPFYKDAEVADDIDAQLRHLEDVLQRPASGRWPDIYSGYSPLCGRHAEWPPIFYMFFSVAAVTEYPKGDLLSFGDLDSGPLVLGFSPFATGFALGAHKLFGDERRFARVYRVFELFGRPRRDGETSSYYLANAMGDAILLYAKVARPRAPGPPGRSMRLDGQRAFSTLSIANSLGHRW